MARYSRFKGWSLTEIFLVAIFVRATAEKSSVAAIHEMQGAKAFIGATLIDGTGAEPKPDAVIVVVDDQINRIGRIGEIDIPVGIRKIDVAGKWVIPGLIDAHVHFDCTHVLTVGRW